MEGAVYRVLFAQDVGLYCVNSSLHLFNITENSERLNELRSINK